MKAMIFTLRACLLFGAVMTASSSFAQTEKSEPASSEPVLIRTTSAGRAERKVLTGATELTRVKRAVSGAEQQEKKPLTGASELTRVKPAGSNSGNAATQEAPATIEKKD